MSVDLVGPDGREYHIESDDPATLAEAQKAGYRPLTEAAPRTPEEERRGTIADINETGRAVGHGLLSGLTFGVAGTGDDVVRAEEEAINAEHPTAHMVGELVGSVASPLNMVGEVVGGAKAATALGRIGQDMLKGAAVGSLYGAGQTVSDAALGDPDLTADKILAHVGLGALLGAAGGGVGSAIEEGVSALLPRIGRAAGDAQSMLDDFANDAAVKATRAQQGVINRIGETRLPEVGQVLRERGHLGLMSTPEDILESVSKDRQALGATLGKFLDDAEAAGKAPSFSQMSQRLDALEAGLNPMEREAIAGDLASARKALQEIGSRPAGATGKAGSGFRALDDLKQTIQAKAKFSRGPVPLDDVTFGLRRQLAGVFRDELDQQLLPQLGSDAAKAFTESKATYGLLKDAERLAESGTKRAGGIGLKDLLAGNLGASLHPMGIAATLGSKFMREHGPALVAKLADKMAGSPVLATMAQSFARTLPATAPKLGAYAPALLNAAAQSPGEALATHMVMAQVDPSYAATAQLAGLTPEDPKTHVASLAKATGLATMAGATHATDAEIDRHIESVLKGTKKPAAPKAMDRQDFGAKRMRREPEASHTKRLEEVRQLAADPNALLERVSANLNRVGPVAPAVSAALAAKASAAIQHLANAGAVPPKPGPLAHDWSVPEADRQAFARKLEVVEEPLSVLRHAASGGLTEEQAETLRAVYPALAKDISDRVLMRIAEGGRVPYGARFMVSMLTGIDPDGTLSAEAIAANQAAISAAGSKPRDEAQGVQGSQDTSDVTLAQRSMTPSQRRELRED